MSKLAKFIDKARTLGKSNEEIRKMLLASGWSDSIVDDALSGLIVPSPQDDLITPPQQDKVTDSQERPIAVVHNLSVRGFEYSIMFISLISSAFSLGGILNTFISNHFVTTNTSGYSSGSDFTSFFTTLLVVVFPIFLILFFRLKKAELNNPTIRLDASRRRWLQFTELVAFVLGIGFIVAFVYQLLNYNADGSPPLIEQALKTLVVLLISGGIFTYYWLDEHRTEQK
jgi:hypothetical protein